MGPTPLQIHAGRKALFTVADLDAELDTSRERIVELAHLDVESDLRLLECKLSDLPPDLARRIVGARAVWRSLALAGNNGAHALGDEYQRLLDEVVYEITAAPAAAPTPSKPRRNKAH